MKHSNKLCGTMNFYTVVGVMEERLSTNLTEILEAGEEIMT